MIYEETMFKSRQFNHFGYYNCITNLFKIKHSLFINVYYAQLYKYRLNISQLNI